MAAILTLVAMLVQPATAGLEFGGYVVSTCTDASGNPWSSGSITHPNRLIDNNWSGAIADGGVAMPAYGMTKPVSSGCS